MNTFRIPIHGMHCINCANGLESKISEIKKLSNIKINLDKNLLSFSIDEISSDLMSEIDGKINEAGFSYGKIQMEFKVTGMNCINCANHLQKEINQIPGIIKADVNLDLKKLSTDSVDGLVTPEDIKSKVIEAGYNAEEIKGNLT